MIIFISINHSFMNFNEHSLEIDLTFTEIKIILPQKIKSNFANSSKKQDHLLTNTNFFYFP